jgi:tetratricopeptide (TPR) repeat protein
VQNIEEALQLARRAGDESMLAYVLYLAAFCYGELGDHARFEPLQIEQIELDHRLGNRSQEATGLGNMAASYAFLGLYKQGRSLLERSSAIIETLGARRLLAYNLGNLGSIYRATGDLRRARQLMEQGLQAIAPVQDTRGKAFILVDLGFVLLAMGDASGAFRRFTEARKSASDHGLRATVAEAAAGLAACAVSQGQLEDASKFAHEAWDHVKEHGWLGMNEPGRNYVSLAETFDALAEPENVRAVIEAAYAALLHFADTINVPELRQSFLQNVPDNRALLEMRERTKP